MNKNGFTPKEEKIAEIFAAMFRFGVAPDISSVDVDTFNALNDEEHVDEAFLKAAIDGKKEATDALKSYQRFLVEKAEDAAVQYVKKARAAKKDSEQ